MRFCSVQVTGMQVSVTMEPIDGICCDAIINPMDVSGSMDLGPSQTLRRYWGPESELQAIYYKEGEVGRCVLSFAEGFNADHFIHTIAADKDGVLNNENFIIALKSALDYSLERGNGTLCIPDFDGFRSTILPEERAFITVSEIRNFIMTNWPPMEEIIIWTNDRRMASIYKQILQNPDERISGIDWLRAPLSADIATSSGITKKDVLDMIIAGCRDADEIFSESGIKKTPEIREALSQITDLYAPIYRRISQVTFKCSRAGKPQNCFGG